MDHVGIAKVWRQRNQEHADSGVVLIWDGEAYGWKNVLRDPQHERPGAIAVDAEGNRGPLGKRKLSYAKRIFCTDGYRLNVTCES